VVKASEKIRKNLFDFARSAGMGVFVEGKESG
jgi:hypothetical protein